MTVSVLQTAHYTLTGAGPVTGALTGTTQHSTIVVFTVNIQALSDDQNGSYTNAGSVTTTEGLVWGVYILRDSAAGTLNLSGTISAGAVGGGGTLIIHEVGGARTSAYTPAVAAVHSSPGTGTDAQTTGNITPTGAPALFVAFGADSSTYVAAPTTGTGFTSLGTFINNGTDSARSESLRVTATTAVAATFTATNGGGDSATLAIVIEETPAPAGVVLSSAIKGSSSPVAPSGPVLFSGVRPAGASPAGTAVSARPPSLVEVPRPPSILKGFGSPPGVAKVSATVAQEPVKSATPNRVAGFGQAAQRPVITQDPFFATATYDPVALPALAPMLYAGVFAAAAGVAAQISAVTVPAPTLSAPAFYAGSANDPGAISGGGVNGAFLPDEAPAPVGPAQFIGVLPSGPAPTATILATPAAPVAPAILAQQLLTGFGQAAQRPVVLTDPQFATATFDPIPFSSPALFGGVTPSSATSVAQVFSSTPSTYQAPPSPVAYLGFGQTAQVATITAPVDARAPVLATLPALIVGAGQAAQPPVTLAASGVPFAGLPPSALAFAGVTPATIAAGTVLSTQDPRAQVRLALGMPIPSLSAGFGQAAQVAVLTRAVDALPPPIAPTPAAYVGSGQAAQSPTIASTTVSTFVGLPPSALLFSGVTSAASPVAAVLSAQDARGQTRTAVAAPTPSLLAGFGQAAQTGSVAFATSAPAPVATTAPIWIAGFGQAAQPPVVLTAAVPARAALAPPSPATVAGFGAAAQPPVILWELVAPSTDLPPTAHAFAGVVPPATTSGAIVQSTIVSPQELPPRGAIAAGAGQATQVGQVVTAPYSAPSVDLFVTGRLVAGFGQTALLPIPYIGTTPRTAPAADLPPAPTRIPGFGLPAQLATVTGTPFAAPPTGLPVSPLTVAGVTPAAPAAATVSSAAPPSLAALPPYATVYAGFGQAAQPAVTYAAPRLPELAGLPPLGMFAPGVVPPTQPATAYVAFVQQPALVALPPKSSILAGATVVAAPTATVLAAPVAAPAALPQSPTIATGFGQAAQPPAVFSAFTAPSAAALPPITLTFTGVSPAAPIAQAAIYGSQPPISAPAPAPRMLSGFGQPAQPPVIVVAPLTTPAADLPARPALFVGVPIPIAAFVSRAAPPSEAQLAPRPLAFAGFGFPAQVAAVITVPFNTTGITLLPPGTSIFAGFGTAGTPFSLSPVERCTRIIDATGLGRLTRIIKAD